ncbi:MAG: hypothetical protein RR256_03985 [Bacteroidales bacterium]
MAKTKERQIARFYYVDKLTTATQAAEQAGVSEQTLSAWVKKYGWKQEREAREQSLAKRTDNLKETISLATQERIALSGELENALASQDKEKIADIRTQIARVDAGVANWSKTLSTVEKEHKITLSIYLEVMDQIFDALRAYNMNLFMQTTDFQDQHLRAISLKLG